MKNIASNTSPFGWIYEPNYGGYSYTHIGYLVSWLGPVLEEDDPYIEISRYSNLFDSVLHIQNILNIKRDNFTDNDEIKKAIMKYGGVVSAIYSTNSVKQHYNESIYPNHEIVIVGWNDTMEIPNAQDWEHGFVKTVGALSGEKTAISMFHIMIPPALQNQTF